MAHSRLCVMSALVAGVYGMLTLCTLSSMQSSIFLSSSLGNLRPNLYDGLHPLGKFTPKSKAKKWQKMYGKEVLGSRNMITLRKADMFDEEEFYKISEYLRSKQKNRKNEKKKRRKRSRTTENTVKRISKLRAANQNRRARNDPAVEVALSAKVAFNSSYQPIAGNLEKQSSGASPITQIYADAQQTCAMPSFKTVIDMIEDRYDIVNVEGGTSSFTSTSWDGSRVLIECPEPWVLYRGRGDKEWRNVTVQPHEDTVVDFMTDYMFFQCGDQQDVLFRKPTPLTKREKMAKRPRPVGTKGTKPPIVDHVVLIMMDAVSRGRFEYQFPETLEYLRSISSHEKMRRKQNVSSIRNKTDRAGAAQHHVSPPFTSFEFTRHIVLGHNTPPNTGALLSGLRGLSYEDPYFEGTKKGLWLFDLFDVQGFETMFAEDLDGGSPRADKWSSYLRGAQTLYGNGHEQFPTHHFFPSEMFYKEEWKKYSCQYPQLNDGYTNKLGDTENEDIVFNDSEGNLDLAGQQENDQREPKRRLADEQNIVVTPDASSDDIRPASSGGKFTESTSEDAESLSPVSADVNENSGADADFEVPEYVGIPFCTAQDLNFRILFDYMKSFLQFHQQKKTFSMTIIDDCHQPGQNYISMDKHLRRELATLMEPALGAGAGSGADSRGKYGPFQFSAHNRTAFVLLSDHGIHYGTEFSHREGWFHHKNPFLFVVLPDALLAHQPEMESALNKNQEAITTHYDVYKTLAHLAYGEKINSTAQMAARHSDDKAEVAPNAADIFGHSLLEPLNSTRSCDDAGVPLGYCPCNATPSCTTNLSDVIGDMATDFIHRRIREEFLSVDALNYVSAEGIESIDLVGMSQSHGRHNAYPIPCLPFNASQFVLDKCVTLSSSTVFFLDHEGFDKEFEVFVRYREKQHEDIPSVGGKSARQTDLEPYVFAVSQMSNYGGDWQECKGMIQEQLEHHRHQQTSVLTSETDEIHPGSFLRADHATTQETEQFITNETIRGGREEEFSFLTPQDYEFLQASSGDSPHERIGENLPPRRRLLADIVDDSMANLEKIKDLCICVMDED